MKLDKRDERGKGKNAANGAVFVSCRKWAASSARRARSSSASEMR